MCITCLCGNNLLYVWWSPPILCVYIGICISTHFYDTRQRDVYFLFCFSLGAVKLFDEHASSLWNVRRELIVYLFAHLRCIEYPYKLRMWLPDLNAKRGYLHAHAVMQVGISSLLSNCGLLLHGNEKLRCELFDATVNWYLLLNGIYIYIYVRSYALILTQYATD